MSFSRLSANVSKTSMNRRFFRKLALFLLPLALLVVLGMGVAFYSGEDMPLSMVIAMQSQDPSLIYSPRSGYALAYKLMMTIQRQPKVMVLGSSRSITFRASLFRDSSVFYNAGNTGWHLDELSRFVHLLNERAKPEVLLLELDQPWFYPDYPIAVQIVPVSDSLDFNTFWQIGRRVWGNLLSGKASLTALLSRQDPSSHHYSALGLAAITDGSGYQADGGWLYGPPTGSPQGRLAAQLQDFQAGRGIFVRGSEVSEDHLRHLAQLLHYCEEQGITVIGFFPPYSPSVYATMQSEGQQTYIPKAAARLTAIFSHYGDTYFDFSDPSPFGVTDGDFHDVWHSDEYVILQIYIAMLRQSPDTLGRYSDLNALETLAQQASDRERLLDFIDNPVS